MTTLVTGAGGFIGRSVVQHLVARGHEVLALVRKPEPTLSDLAERNRCLRLATGDLASLSTLADSARSIVHAAALSPGPGFTIAAAMETNARGTATVRDYARRSKSRLVVYLSSVSVYGDVKARIVGPETPSINAQGYGLSKLLGEQALLESPHSFGMVFLRLPGIISTGGGRARTGEHSVWIGRVLDNLRRHEPVAITNAHRPFNNLLHLDDLTALIADCLNATPPSPVVCTPAARMPLTVAEIVQRLRRNIGSRSMIHDQGESQPSFHISLDWSIPGVMFSPRTVAQTADSFSAGLAAT